jgi:hypothetical protein
MIWVLLRRRRLFGPFWPIVLALMAYRRWRGLSPERRADLRKRARDVAARAHPPR